jgi:hypothetical protein
MNKKTYIELMFEELYFKGIVSLENSRKGMNLDQEIKIN